MKWITGHNFLNRHIHLLNPDITLSAMCRLCHNQEETSWHLAAMCGAFNEIRFKHFNAYQLTSPPVWNGQDLVGFLREEMVIETERRD